MGWWVLLTYHSLNLLMLHPTVVVRTGDHTMIGDCKPLIGGEQLTEHSLGQIAALTGSESGNKSPLAVEMYAPSFR